MLPFHTILTRDPLKQLLRSGMYPVVNAVVTEFGGVVGEQQLRAMRRGIREFGPRIRIEERQREDGSWESADGVRSPAQQSVLTLFKLADFGADEFDATTQLGVDYLYGLQQPNGLLPLTLAENGFALLVLSALGYRYNRNNNQLLQRLLTLQREDGGWGQAELPADEGEADSPEPPSDISTTLHVLLGFSGFEAYADAPEMQNACQFLGKSLFERTRSKGYRRRRDWQDLYYDWDERGAFGWPSVKLLYLLSCFGYQRGDGLVQTLFRWIRDAQLPNGMWGFDDDGHEWLTLWVLRALRRLFYPDHKPEFID